MSQEKQYPIGSFVYEINYSDVYIVVLSDTTKGDNKIDKVFLNKEDAEKYLLKRGYKKKNRLFQKAIDFTMCYAQIIKRKINYWEEK